jgi:predicted ATPase
MRRRAFGALRALLANLAHGAPLVVVADDLQWGDVDSAALLAEILRPPDAPPLLLLGVHRSEDRDTSPFLRALRAFHDFQAHAGATVVVRLAELPPADAQALALAVIGSPGDGARARAATIAREAAGNPFFIRALAGLAGTRLVGRDGAGGGFQVDDVDAPETLTLDALVERRAALLPRDARALLEVVAVAGQPIRRSLARRAAGLDADYPAAAAALAAAGLLRTRGADPEELLETSHDRIREAVVAHLPPALRAARHGALARALEQLPEPDLETLAMHHLGAGDTTKAAGYAAAAERASAREIARQQALHATPTAQLVRAGVASHAGARGDAVTLLAAAEDGFRAADTAAHAAIARRRRGQLVGGPDGAVLVAHADAWLGAQGACRPERSADLFAPGAWNE